MGRPAADLLGNTFGRLTVRVRHKEPSASGRVRWVCACTCGRTAVVSTQSLRAGTQSCGCYQREWASKNAYVHGFKGTPEYASWRGMHARCNNPNNKSYPGYGARGIRVCAEWSDAARFISDMGPRPLRASIDRVKNNEGYSKGNCRWGTKKQQAENRRTVKTFNIDGVEYRSRVSLAMAFGVNIGTLRMRLAQGQSPAEAVRPPGVRGKKYLAITKISQQKEPVNGDQTNHVAD